MSRVRVLGSQRSELQMNGRVLQSQSAPFHKTCRCEDVFIEQRRSKSPKP